MVQVVHILKNGDKTNDITGHVVRIEDADQVYRLIDDINHEIHKRGKKYDEKIK